MKEKILALIPARGGSKGVPRKNIRSIAGKPLISYSIESAIAAGDDFYRVLVSTDDPEIAEISLKYGAEVPFLRPKDLGGDKIAMLPVIKHAIQFVENQDQVKIDWVFLMQPTAPLRTKEDIHNAIQLAKAGGCDSVISVVQVFAVHPILMKRIENDQLLPFCVDEKEGTRRQDYQPAAYMRNGAIYLTKRDVLMDRNSIWGDTIRPYIMPEERSLNIDSEMDLKLVDLILSENLRKENS